jgi:hypothetical protein
VEIALLQVDMDMTRLFVTFHDCFVNLSEELKFFRVLEVLYAYTNVINENKVTGLHLLQICSSECTTNLIGQK